MQCPARRAQVHGDQPADPFTILVGDDINTARPVRLAGGLSCQRATRFASTTWRLGGAGSWAGLPRNGPRSASGVWGHPGDSPSKVSVPETPTRPVASAAPISGPRFRRRHFQHEAKSHCRQKNRKLSTRVRRFAFAATLRGEEKRIDRHLDTLPLRQRHNPTRGGS